MLSYAITRIAFLVFPDASQNPNLKNLWCITQLLSTIDCNMGFSLSSNLFVFCICICNLNLWFCPKEVGRMWVPALRGDLVCLLWIWVWIGDLLLLRGRSHYQGLCAITSDPLLSSAHPRPRPLQVELAHCGHKEGWVDQQDNCSARQHKMSPLLCNMMGFEKKRRNYF